ncbi:MAG TPA: prepilin peptidase [Xanthobacteraceae bacterium]
MATAAVLFYAALTDLKHFQIRNELIVVLTGLFVLHAVVSGRWPGIPWNVGLALLILALMLYFYAQDLLGGGDVKLLAVAFLWAGIDCALPFALLLSLFATLHALAGKLGWVDVKRVGEDKRARIAFAPSVAAALIGIFMLGCLSGVP